MRKIKFYVNGKLKEGYFVGISGMKQNSAQETQSVLLVEDLEGKIYSVVDYDVTFLGKPIHTAPPKYIDLKLMRNALTSLKDSNANYTIQDLINLAVEQNIVIQDTEEY